jgi:predicted kinase
VDDEGVTPKLILINGIPASGKSTLARAWCERQAVRLPLALDIDALRAMLGGWRGALHEAGLAARELAIAAIDAHVRSGRDVVVPQYLRRPEFIERLEATAHARGALFVETALIVDPAEAEARFRARAAALGLHDPHGDQHAEMATIAQDFEAFLARRGGVVRLPGGDGALPALEAAVDSPA